MLAIVPLWHAPISAEEFRLRPTIEARLRWERVDQDGFAQPADAVTARARAGLIAQRDAWQLLVEAQATLALVERYDSGTNRQNRYPLIVDPQNVALSRVQLRYAGTGWTLTAGRQRLPLADERFVGTAAIRQAAQTFDALRMQYGRPDALFADVTYAWSQRTVNGIDGRGARQQAVSGDNVFALVGARIPIGTLTGFAYLVDQDEPAVQGFRLSSQTWGARLIGELHPGAGLRLTYVLSAARQADWHRNPNDYSADYRLAEATIGRGGIALTGGYEMLGADDGRPLTSVQTPLSSIFKFQGWADRFVTTPPDGIRDLYGTVGYAWPRLGGFSDATVSATWHRFGSDRLERRYGHELDLLAAAKRGRALWSLRFAHYRADTFATDTDKLWVQLDWTL